MRVRHTVLEGHLLPVRVPNAIWVSHGHPAGGLNGCSIRQNSSDTDNALTHPGKSRDGGDSETSAVPFEAMCLIHDFGKRTSGTNAPGPSLRPHVWHFCDQTYSRDICHSPFDLTDSEQQPQTVVIDSSVPDLT